MRWARGLFSCFGNFVPGLARAPKPAPAKVAKREKEAPRGLPRTARH